jgi:hypothetical protein
MHSGSQKMKNCLTQVHEPIRDLVTSDDVQLILTSFSQPRFVFLLRFQMNLNRMPSKQRKENPRRYFVRAQRHRAELQSLKFYHRHEQMSSMFLQQSIRDGLRIHHH